MKTFDTRRQAENAAVNYLKGNGCNILAENWMSEHEWKGDYQLAAVEISDDNFAVTNFVDDVF